jgi:small subunit ribosomal protein S9
MLSLILRAASPASAAGGLLRALSSRAARGLVDESGADSEDEAARRARTEIDGAALGLGASASARSPARRGAGAASPAPAPGAAPPPLSSQSSLGANPYGYAAQQPGQAAPLWMLYEAGREERPLARDASGARSRLADNAATTVRAAGALRDAAGRAYATGRRKEAVARVWVGAGDGAVRANGGALADALPRLSDRAHALEPLVVTQTAGAVDILLTTKGGGTRGQAGAVRHGLANALARWDPALKPVLRRCACASARAQRARSARAARHARRRPCHAPPPAPAPPRPARAQTPSSSATRAWSSGKSPASARRAPSSSGSSGDARSATPPTATRARAGPLAAALLKSAPCPASPRPRPPPPLRGLTFRTA